jgi:DNA-binding response OmpR family regulator
MDDSPMVLDASSDALGQAGFSVSCVTDLESFERAIAAEAPDLVLMDVQMPEAFGDDIAMVMKAIRGFQRPIYLFSTLDDADLAARVQEAELDGWISKRAGIDAMVARVRQILGP